MHQFQITLAIASMMFMLVLNFGLLGSSFVQNKNCMQNMFDLTNVELNNFL